MDRCQTLQKKVDNDPFLFEAITIVLKTPENSRCNLKKETFQYVLIDFCNYLYWSE